MTIGEKRPCVFCNKEVEIVGEVMEGDVAHQKLSCGHASDSKIINVRENISLREIVQSDVIRFQTLSGEGAPMQVSGISSGMSQMISLAGFQGTINNTGILSIDLYDLNFNYSPGSISSVNTTTTNFNNIQDIFSEIDKSDSSREDR